MSTVRDEILAKLRQAPRMPLPCRETVPAPAAETASALLARLGGAVQGLNAAYVRAASRKEARAALAAILAERTVKSAACWEHPLLEALGVADILAAAGISTVVPGEDGDACRRIAGTDVGVTAVDAGLADTGSIIVRTGPGRPRSVSLLPPLHLAVVEAARVRPGIDDFPDIFEQMRQEAGEGDCRLPSGIHCITGPSCTADIELVKTYGVHGPVSLVVLGLDFTP